MVDTSAYVELKKFNSNGDLNIHKEGDVYYSEIDKCWKPISPTYYGLPVWPTHPKLMRLKSKDTCAGCGKDWGVNANICSCGSTEIL